MKVKKVWFGILLNAAVVTAALTATGVSAQVQGANLNGTYHLSN
jgi:hypothetical protein